VNCSTEAQVLAVLSAHHMIGNNPEDAPECTCGEWGPGTATRDLEEHDEHVAAMLVRPHD
jgi:hypothetical protein